MNARKWKLNKVKKIIIYKEFNMICIYLQIYKKYKYTLYFITILPILKSIYSNIT